jgi:hypothetical protein
MNGRKNPSHPQHVVLPPLIQVNATADFILSPSKAKRPVDFAAKINEQPQSPILPKLQVPPLVTSVHEEVPISRELAAKFKVDRRTTEEIRSSKLTYMLQSKYVVLLSLSDAQETLLANQVQLSKLLTHRDVDPYPSAENLQEQEELKEEILIGRAEVASLTTEYNALSTDPDLQKFEKNAVAKDLAMRSLQKRLVAMGLPYLLPIPRLKEGMPSKKARLNKTPLPVIYEERPKGRGVYDKFPKPVNMAKLENCELNNAVPAVSPTKFKHPKKLISLPYFPAIIPKQGHGRYEQLKGLEREQVVNKQEYTPPDSRFIEGKPKPLAAARRPGCFFAISPPISPLKQPKKAGAVVTPAIVLRKTPLISRQPKLILGNGAQGPACFFGIGSHLLSPLKSPVLPVLKLGNVQQSADDIQITRDKKSPR